MIPSMPITLSDGSTVTFKPFISHGAETAMLEDLFRDDQVTRVSSMRAFRTLLTRVIDSPAPTDAYLDGLPAEDYNLLFLEAKDMFDRLKAAKDEAEKKREAGRAPAQ